MFDVRVDLKRLEDRIAKFEEKPIEEGKIMFYGASGFTRWGQKHGHRPLEDDILMKDGSRAAINHGFGTSTVEELLYFYHRAVLPWKPRALVILNYGNNPAQGYSVNETLTLMARLCAYARCDIPGIKLYLCDASPTVKCMENPFEIERRKEFNSLLKAYCDRYDDCTYVCHTESPLFYEKEEDVGSYEKVRRDIFIEDDVHFNQKGYDIYKKFFTQVLDEIL